jgi:uncharacterized membrane protein HdeD (DUF308 family)
MESRGARRALGWGLVIGILLAILGIIAIARPLVAGVAATLVFGWVLLLSGVSQIVHAFRSRREGHFWVNLAVGLAHVVAGGLLLFYPLGGLVTLTLVIGVAILVEGVIQTVAALQARPAPGWGWLLLSGIMSVMLGTLIWVRWPTNALWLVGVFIGVNLIFRGVMLATLSGYLRSTFREQKA